VNVKVTVELHCVLFLMLLTLLVMLQLYHHGENIAVNVHIANNSNRTVKKIKVSGKYTHNIPVISRI